MNGDCVVVPGGGNNRSYHTKLPALFADSVDQCPKHRIHPIHGRGGRSDSGNGWNTSPSSKVTLPS